MLPDYFKIFQAEVSAIQAAVKIIVDKNVHRQKITTLSNSQAVIKALDSSVINSKTVYDCCRCPTNVMFVSHEHRGGF